MGWARPGIYVTLVGIFAVQKMGYSLQNFASVSSASFSSSTRASELLELVLGGRREVSSVAVATASFVAGAVSLAIMQLCRGDAVLVGLACGVMC